MSSKLLAAFLILFSISAKSLPAHANNENQDPSESPHLIIKAPLTEKTEALITVTEQEETTPEQIQELLQSRETQNADIIVSTDQESVVEAAVRATSSSQDKRLLRFIPIGKLANAKEKIASGFKNYYDRAKFTLMHDRIGLMVLTITTGYDTLIWIHSASFDIQQKTSMVMMNLMMAATFGLDRDLWTKMTSPLKNKLIKTFDRFMVSEKFARLNVLSGQFLSGLIFGIGIQTIRTGLLSLDHLADVVMTSAFWLKAVKISGLITLTTFAWTEMYGAIDQKINPVAKLTMKRFAEMRGIIMAHFASISMVLQPEVYGHTPAVSFVVHGAIGLAVLLNMHRVVDYLENNPLVNKIYKKVQTFETFINNSFQFGTRRETVFRCESLFAS